jgi:hypothetical protein
MVYYSPITGLDVAAICWRYIRFSNGLETGGIEQRSAIKDKL